MIGTEKQVAFASDILDAVRTYTDMLIDGTVELDTGTKRHAASQAKDIRAHVEIIDLIEAGDLVSAESVMQSCDMGIWSALVFDGGFDYEAKAMKADAIINRFIDFYNKQARAYK